MYIKTMYELRCCFLLARWTCDGSAQLYRAAKVRCVVGVEVNLLRHGVSTAVARSSAVGSGVVNIPDLLAVGASEETILQSAQVGKLLKFGAHPLCPGP